MSEDSDFAFLSTILQKHPEWANWTLDDLRAEQCRLEAKIEDEARRHAQVYRQAGFAAVEDMVLFNSVWKNRRACRTLPSLMDSLRSKAKRGHRQQEALDTYDAHYAMKDAIDLPGDADIAKLERRFEMEENIRYLKSIGWKPIAPPPYPETALWLAENDDSMARVVDFSGEFGVWQLRRFTDGDIDGVATPRYQTVAEGDTWEELQEALEGSSK